jgi:hypothetical protein
MESHEGVTDQKDYWCVHCGLDYDGDPITTVTGLDHLEGKTVAILADGFVHPPQVVVSGSISLEYEASRIIVGLPYTCKLKTMRLEVADPEGTSQGQMKKIVSVVLRFLNSLWGSCGPSEAELLPIPYWGDDRDHPTPYWEADNQFFDGQATPFTGDVELTWPGGNDRNGQLMVVQDHPFPLTLLAVIAEVDLD